MPLSGEIISRAEEEYEIELQVADRLLQMRDVDEYLAGTTSLSIGLRFAATFSDIKKGLPFFRNSIFYLKSADARDKSSGIKGFDPQRAYRRMRIQWGIYGLQRVLDSTDEIERMRKAVKALLPSFSGAVFDEFVRRIEGGEEDVTSVSIVQLAFLGLVAMLRQTDSNTEYRQEIESCLSLPVTRRYVGVRDSIGEMIIGDHSESVSAYMKEFKNLIILENYHDGLISGLTFNEAWILSSLYRGAEVVKGAELLFD